jgi:hypothetical protein
MIEKASSYLQSILTTKIIGVSVVMVCNSRREYNRFFVVLGPYVNKTWRISLKRLDYLQYTLTTCIEGSPAGKIRGVAGGL